MADLKVLVIEDDYREAQRMVRHISDAIPPDVVTSDIVYSSLEAIKSVKHNNYDVILLDLLLDGSEDGPTQDHLGVDVMKHLQTASPDSKIVVYSSYLRGHKDLARRPDISGADYIFRKPSGADLLPKGLGEKLQEFLHTKDDDEARPSSDLVVPVRRTISAVNRGLAQRFARDPELVRSITPESFEELVAELFDAQGYEVALTGRGPDGGKDIYVYKRDPMANSLYIVECKRYLPPHKVDVKVARQLYSIVQHERANAGILVTTSFFTEPAEAFAATIPYQLLLRDYYDLIRWLERHRDPDIEGAG
jgi:restriction system protein